MKSYTWDTEGNTYAVRRYLTDCELNQEPSLDT